MPAKSSTCRAFSYQAKMNFNKSQRQHNVKKEGKYNKKVHKIYIYKYNFELS